MDERTKVVHRYAIAETFDSIQGEGHWVGTRMFFVRMAGCSVGKPFLGSSAPYYERCTLYDGRFMTCDTDYRVKERLTTVEILSRIPANVERVCVTGGEPMNQPLRELILGLFDAEKNVHIETSGTVYPPEWLDRLLEADDWERERLWITVSPKEGVLDDMLAIADEIKILVDEDFSLEKLPTAILDLEDGEHPNLFLQPVNPIDRISQENTKKAVDIIMKMRDRPWRLSVQAHKVWGVR